MPINELIAQGGLTNPFNALQSYGNVLNLKQMQRQMADYPIEQNSLRSARQSQARLQDAQARLQDAQAQALEGGPVTDPKDRIIVTKAALSATPWMNYDRTQKYLAEVNGIPLPTVDELKKLARYDNVDPENPKAMHQWFEQQKPKFYGELDKAAANIKMNYQQTAGGEYVGLPSEVAPGTTSISPIPTGVKGKPPAESLSPIGKLIEEYNGLPPDSPNKSVYLAAIKKATASTGTQIRVNPDGTIEFYQGPDAANALSPTIEKAVDTKTLNASELLSRLGNIEDSFKPEYLQAGNRLQGAWTGFKARLGLGVSVEDEKWLTDWKQFQRGAIENINLYIKEITGAQMSEPEARRLRLAQPDPGEKWYQGDDPITFKSKMDDVITQAKKAISRFEYYKNQGMSEKQIIDIINKGQARPLNAFGIGSPPKADEEMPDPSANKGKVIVNPDTGERRQSDGKEWVSLTPPTTNKPAVAPPPSTVRPTTPTPKVAPSPSAVQPSAATPPPGVIDSTRITKEEWDKAHPPIQPLTFNPPPIYQVKPSTNVPNQLPERLINPSQNALIPNIPPDIPPNGQQGGTIEQQFIVWVMDSKKTGVPLEVFLKTLDDPDNVSLLKQLNIPLARAKQIVNGIYGGTNALAN